MSESKPSLKEQNRKLLDVLQAKLSSPERYLVRERVKLMGRLKPPPQPAAKKFGPWLNSDRAYYPEARPQILRNLEVAAETLQRHSNEVAPEQRQRLVEAFLSLVFYIQPFGHHFVEPDEQGRLQSIFSSATYWQQFAPPPASTSNAPSLAPSPTHPSLPTGVMPEAPAVSHQPPVLSPSDVIVLDNPSNVPARETTTELPSPAEAPIPPATTIPVTMKPIRKSKNKRKRMDADLDKFVEADAQIYKQHRTAAQSSATVSPIMVHNITELPITSTPPNGAVLERGTEQDPIVVTKSETRIDEPVPSNLATVETVVNAPESIEPLKMEPQDVEMLDVESNQAPHLTPEMEAEVDRVYHKLTVPLSVQQAIAHSSTASSTGQPATGVFPVSRPHSPQAVPNVEAVLNHAATEPVPNIPYEEEVDAIAIMQDFIKNIVMKVNERIALDTQAAESIKDPAQLAEDIPNEVSTATGIVAEAIIGRHRGSAQGPFTMNFSISQHQLDALTLWNERWKHTESIESSLCISLLCFKEADIRARLDPAKKIDFRSLLRDLECCWPKSGDLSASWNGQPTQLPIAPPLAYRSDESAIVDISPFVSLGPNNLTFTQNADLTSYCFVLCAHNPSPAQLRAVQRRRYKEQSWMAWLQKQTKPLPLPFKLPIPMDS